MAPVSFLSSEGLRIKAQLELPPGEGKAPAAVICHGFGGCSCDLNLQAIAKRLVSKGIAALLFDYSHVGESEGPPLTWTISQALDDVGAALDFLRAKERIDDTRMGAVGFSLGGALAIHRAAFDTRIKAVAAISAPALFGEGLFTREELDGWKRQGRLLVHFAHGPVELSWQFALDSQAFDTVRAARRLKAPLLTVQGSADDIVPAPTARLISEAAAGPVKTVLVEGAGHDYRGPGQQHQLAHAVADWMAEQLTPR
jgi:fermentation-respiration switch protein FrsA (DUF1100 family)